MAHHRKLNVPARLINSILVSTFYVRCAKKKTRTNVYKCVDVFKTDHIGVEGTTTKDLYDKLIKPMVLSTLNGFNAIVFAYGDSSSGNIEPYLR